MAPFEMNEAEWKVLQSFDGNTRFGPAIGLPRMDRWKRAEALGLAPPQSVYEILSKHAEQERRIKPYTNAKGFK